MANCIARAVTVFACMIGAACFLPLFPAVGIERIARHEVRSDSSGVEVSLGDATWPKSAQLCLGIDGRANTIITSASDGYAWVRPKQASDLGGTSPWDFTTRVPDSTAIRIQVWVVQPGGAVVELRRSGGAGGREDLWLCFRNRAVAQQARYTAVRIVSSRPFSLERVAWHVELR